MQRIIGLFIIIALFFQGIGFLAVASISHNETIVQQSIATFTDENQQSEMYHSQQDMEKSDCIHHAKEEIEENCQHIHKMIADAKAMSAEKECNLACNIISSPYLPTNTIVTKTLILQHDYLQILMNKPKQSYYTLLEKPPKL